MADYESFMKRWNISYNEEEINEAFKNAVLTIIQERLIYNWDDELDMNFCKDAHLLYEKYSIFPSLDGYDNLSDLLHSNMYSKISLEKKMHKLIFYLQCLLSVLKGKGGYKPIIKDLKKLISELPINLNLKESKDGMIFYPKGVKFLDRELIDTLLDWLDSYPDIKKHFKSALEKYQAKKFERNLLDDLRFSYENLVKKILGNRKSLENQKDILLKYLNNKKVPNKICKMYWTLTNYFCDYQNEHVKHNDKVDEKEIEFVLYLTATFMRYLLSLQ